MPSTYGESMQPKKTNRSTIEMFLFSLVVEQITSPFYCSGRGLDEEQGTFSHPFWTLLTPSFAICFIYLFIYLFVHIILLLIFINIITSVIVQDSTVILVA